jgi:hypothetical protein
MMILVAASTLVSLVALHVSQILTSSILFDDAFIANVAKNLAAGNGYSSSYYYIHPFDPEITTGPLVVVPAAILMLMFGNRYWVPNLGYAVCLWTLLIVVLTVLYRRMRVAEFAVATFLLALGLLVFSTQEFGLLGEIPAVLLVALGALAIAGAESSLAHSLAGVALSVAVTTKNITALAFPAFVIALTIWGRSAGRWRNVRWFLGGFALPLILEEAWKCAARGSIASWVQLKRAEVELLLGDQAISGATTLRSALERPWILVDTAVRNGGTLMADWGGGLALLAAAGATLAAVWRRGTQADASRVISLRTAAFILFGAGALHLVWWILLSPTGWARHLLPAVIYWLIAMAILTALQLQRSAFLATITTVMLVVALIPQLWKVPAPHFRAELSARTMALVATSDRVHRLRAEHDVILLGCDWWHNPDVDYLLPAGANFRDCLKVAPGDVRDKTLVLVRSEFFNWERSERLQRFQDLCEQHVLFRKAPFVVSECPSLP